MKVLAILEVSRKQEYIFASKKLRDNAHRSDEIAWVTGSKFLKEAAKDLYQESENMVYNGGGHTVLQFDAEDEDDVMDHAKAVISAVTEKVLTEFDGLELFAKLMTYDPDKTPGENLKELSAALERKKSRREGSFRQLSYGVEQLSSENFKPVGKGGTIGKVVPDQILPPEGWEFPTQFEELSQSKDGDDKENFIAVIHIDGNSMGKRVDEVYKNHQSGWENCIEGLRKFSNGIQRDFENAFRETVDEVVSLYPDLKPMVPIRPVILAGDDVCFVTAGDIGLECARVFLEKLAVKTNAEDGKEYAACAGVALVHVKYPFHKAYELAEELCSSAKKYGTSINEDGKVCAMDWHIEFGQLKDSLSELREDYITEDEVFYGKDNEEKHNPVLHLRPVVVLAPDKAKVPEVRTYAYFRALCRGFQEESGNAARSKVKELRTALKQGRTESEYFLQEQQISDLLLRSIRAEFRDDQFSDWMRSIQKEGGKVSREAFRNLGTDEKPDYRCLFFDAIEMEDHFTAFQEVNAE